MLLTNYWNATMKTGIYLEQKDELKNDICILKNTVF